MPHKIKIKQEKTRDVKQKIDAVLADKSYHVNLTNKIKEIIPKSSN